MSDNKRIEEQVTAAIAELRVATSTVEDVLRERAEAINEYNSAKRAQATALKRFKAVIKTAQQADLVPEKAIFDSDLGLSGTIPMPDSVAAEALLLMEPNQLLTPGLVKISAPKFREMIATGELPKTMEDMIIEEPGTVTVRFSREVK